MATIFRIMALLWNVPKWASDIWTIFIPLKAGGKAGNFSVISRLTHIPGPAKIPHKKVIPNPDERMIPIHHTVHRNLTLRLAIISKPEMKRGVLQVKSVSRMALNQV